MPTAQQPRGTRGEGAKRDQGSPPHSPGQQGLGPPKDGAPTSLGTCLREGVFPNAQSQPYTAQQVLTGGDIQVWFPVLINISCNEMSSRRVRERKLLSHSQNIQLPRAAAPATTNCL